MKRKASSINGSEASKPSNKKRSITEPSAKSPKIPKTEDVRSNFRKGLFDKKVLEEYTAQHAKSAPYKHAVIHELMDDSLLRNVRNEIQENVSFTPKETDIYKIHQSGDLANLDGLEDAALAKLPSLLKLRDSLYSKEFREYVATLTGLGKGGLSGKKTDMAINVYLPGCYLLCHDDVIGSRRISYILYLTDPDIPWKAEWGGALRLFPTIEADGEEKSFTPKPDTTKSIPPAWNQLSFFVVQPGESFHDVQEVYHAESAEALEKDGGRIRMAISGWFHIPQEGEEGYIEGFEASLATKSSLAQLQGKASKFDFPEERKIAVDRTSEQPQELEDGDFEFLLKYMAPAYLTPDTMESVTEHFGAACSITLDGILSKKFAARLKYEIEKQDAKALVEDTDAIEEKFGGWKVARPPHKHRFMYKHPVEENEKEKGKGKDTESETPALDELLNIFLPSRQFRQWLELATECQIEDSDIIARRFRRGRDYALATSHEGSPQLEFSLGLTPSPGWIIDDDEEEGDGDGNEEEDDSEEMEERDGDENKKESKDEKNKSTTTKGKGKPTTTATSTTATKKSKQQPSAPPPPDLGGQEIYMASDTDTSPSSKAADAAIYKASSEEESPVLFDITPSWNTLNIVLRDQDTLRFVKAVSAAAKGDRWDVLGVMGVREDEDEDEGGEEEGEGEEGEEGEDNGEGEEEKGDSQETVVTLEDLESDGEDEETFNGFSDSGSESE